MKKWLALLLAAALVLMEESLAAKLGLAPIGEVTGYAVAGVHPHFMGMGPMAAVPKLLKKTGKSLADIDVIEINEAFAAQAVPCCRELGFDMDRVNVNGGAIALGHPVGSSGCRILVTLVHEMKKRGLKYGLATLCIAGGMGQATVIEMCE